MPADYIPSPRRSIPIRKFEMETDNSEWGKTLTSLLQLEVIIQPNFYLKKYL